MARGEWRARSVLRLRPWVWLAGGLFLVAGLAVVAPRRVSAASHTTVNVAYVNYDDSGFTGSGIPSGNIFANAIQGGPAPS